MALVDDNAFPKVILAEGSAPASPSAGQFKLYVDSSDHLLKYKNSAGVVTTLGAGLTDPMSARGDIIVRNASNVTARLAIGSTGKVLSSDGTDISWQTPAAGGGALVFLETHTASASATLDFTTFISATYDTYVFYLVNVVPASTANLLIRMGTGGGPTYDTGANYGSASNEGRAGGIAVGGAEGGATSIALTRNSIGTTANWPGAVGTVTLFAPGGALYKVVRSSIFYGSADPFRILDDAIGDYDSTTAVTAVRFLMSTGNIASGTIRVYGVTKS